MGEVAAANATNDTLDRWHPRHIICCGIAGGFPQDDLDLGDVVVADQVVGFDYGKIKPRSFQWRDRVYPASAKLLERIRNFWDSSWTNTINSVRPASANRSYSKHFIGLIASGNKVIASTSFRNKLLRRWPRLHAVEMEGEGFHAAALEHSRITDVLVVRGICDMADEREDDAWQVYAANAAAAFLIEFLKSGPVDPV